MEDRLRDESVLCISFNVVQFVSRAFEIAPLPADALSHFTTHQAGERERQERLINHEDQGRYACLGI